MTSIKMNSRTMPVFLETYLDDLAGRSAAGVKFYVEDGWIFRELPGKGIECISRAGDLHVVDLQSEMEKMSKRVAAIRQLTP